MVEQARSLLTYQRSYYHAYLAMAPAPGRRLVRLLRPFGVRPVPTVRPCRRMFYLARNARRPGRPGLIGGLFFGSLRSVERPLR